MESGNVSRIYARSKHDKRLKRDGILPVKIITIQAFTLVNINYHSLEISNER